MCCVLQPWPCVQCLRACWSGFSFAARTGGYSPFYWFYLCCITVGAGLREKIKASSLRIFLSFHVVIAWYNSCINYSNFSGVCSDLYSFFSQLEEKVEYKSWREPKMCHYYDNYAKKYSNRTTRLKAAPVKTFFISNQFSSLERSCIDWKYKIIKPT